MAGVKVRKTRPGGEHGEAGSYSSQGEKEPRHEQASGSRDAEGRPDFPGTGAPAGVGCQQPRQSVVQGGKDLHTVPRHLQARAPNTGTDGS